MSVSALQQVKAVANCGMNGATVPEGFKLQFPSGQMVVTIEMTPITPPGPRARRCPMIAGLGVIPSLVTTRLGECDVCGLPGSVSGLMEVPDVNGHYCSASCVELHLFGRGKCRWCGFPLDPGQPAFCCDHCLAHYEASGFVSGKRLALWLSRHDPRLFAQLVGKEIPSGIACLRCGASLDGRRRDTLFCHPNCQQAFKRSRYNPANCDCSSHVGTSEPESTQSCEREF